MKPGLFARLMTRSDAMACVAMSGILGGIVVGSTLQGCSQVCAQIEANAPVLNSKLADTQRAISDVESSGIRERLSGPQLSTFDDALQKVKEGHALAVQSIALAEDACRDPRPYLDMIVQGWDVVRTFLALIGGEGTPVIADPVLWQEAQ